MADESPNPPIRNVKPPRPVGGRLATKERILQPPDLAHHRLIPVRDTTPDFDTSKPEP